MRMPDCEKQGNEQKQQAMVTNESHPKTALVCCDTQTVKIQGSQIASANSQDYRSGLVRSVRTRRALEPQRSSSCHPVAIAAKFITRARENKLSTLKDAIRIGLGRQPTRV